MIGWLLTSLALGEPLPGTFSVASDPRDTIEETRQQERNVLDEMAALDQDLEAVAAEVVALQQRRVELEERQTALEEDLAVTEAELQDHRSNLISWVRVLYMLNRQGLARIIFGAEAPHTLRRRSTYLMSIIQADAQRMDDFTRASARRTQALINLQGGMSDLSNLGAELRLKEADLKDQRARKLELLTEIRSQRALALSVMQEMNQTRTAFNSGNWSGQGWGNNTPSNNAGAASFSMGNGWGEEQRPRCNNAGSFRATYGELPWPADGVLLRDFGPYTDPQTGQREHNDGLDISGPFGSPVTAVYGGIVKIAEYMRLYGYTVAIEHGAYTTVYAHLNGMRVRVGQEVCAGDQIGSIGDSGLTDGSAELLEFQIRYNNTPQDPLPWLRSQ